MGADGQYYWLYGSGQGQTSAQVLPTEEQRVIEALNTRDCILLTDKVSTIVSYDNEDSVSVLEFSVVIIKTECLI